MHRHISAKCDLTPSLGEGSEREHLWRGTWRWASRNIRGRLEITRDWEHLGSSIRSHPGSSGIPWTKSGVVWEQMESSGMIWDLLGSSGITWAHLISPGFILDHLGSYWIIWTHLESSRIIWKYLGSFWIFWDPLGSRSSENV